MLGQLEGLALVVGTSVAVEVVGDVEAVEEVELEEGLAVFDEEGDVVGADLEDGALAQLEAEEGQLLKALGDGAALGEEAGADPMAVGS